MTMPVEVVRHFYDALGRGDVPAVLALLDAQVEWTEAEGFPYYGGTWQGPQAGTVRDGKLAKFDMHTDTAKVLTAMQD
jgi:limonene-1,2-epoxide hydrolase